MKQRQAFGVWIVRMKLWVACVDWAHADWYAARLTAAGVQCEMHLATVPL